MSLFWRHINFICVASKVGNKRNGGVTLSDNPRVVELFSFDNLLEQNFPSTCQVPGARHGFCFNCLKDKVGCVDLAMRMRIRDAYNLAFVFKHQYMIDLRTATELPVLGLPCCKEILDLFRLELSK